MRTRWFHLYECGLGFAVCQRPRARRRPPCEASSNGVASAERPGEIHQRGMTQLRIANAGPATQAIAFVISTAVFLAASGSRVLSSASPHGEPTPTRYSCFKFAAGREWLLVADDPPVGTIICCRARAAQTACEPCSCEHRLLSQHSPSGAEPSPLSALEGNLLGPLTQSQLEDLESRRPRLRQIHPQTHAASLRAIYCTDLRWPALLCTQRPPQRWPMSASLVCLVACCSGGGRRTRQVSPTRRGPITPQTIKRREQPATIGGFTRRGPRDISRSLCVANNAHGLLARKLILGSLAEGPILMQPAAVGAAGGAEREHISSVPTAHRPLCPVQSSAGRSGRAGKAILVWEGLESDTVAG